MPPRRLKTGYFILEGFNSFATVFYFYYFYFFMQQAFGFGNKANLALAALNGGTYAVGAWLGGKFAQRFGYFTALKLGLGIMLGALAVATQLTSPGSHIAAMLVTVIGMCFTWPTLEALVSEGEPAGGLQHMVGIYNVVWAGTAALANFSGGAMLEKLGLKSLFVVPIGIQLIQLALTFWLEGQARRVLPAAAASVPGASAPEGLSGQDAGASGAAGPRLPDGGVETDESRRRGRRRSQSGAGLPDGAVRTAAAGSASSAASDPRSQARARVFLRLAWLANPFAYVAINTLVAVMPGIAHRLELSTMLAGFCGSVWCFARLGAFFGLWFWNGWHYRFRWLLAAYLMLVGTFSLILTVPNLAVLVLAQMVFGGALGLIYYSSLFYSMDLSETKGEHGGIHEAAIGLGNCAGPAIGAVSLQFLPQYTNSGAVAVSVLLLFGLGGLLAIWRSGTAAAAAILPQRAPPAAGEEIRTNLEPQKFN